MNVILPISCVIDALNFSTTIGSTAKFFIPSDDPVEEKNSIGKKRFHKLLRKIL